MNKVILYQTTKSEHLTYSGHIAASQLTYDDVTRIRGSDNLSLENECLQLKTKLSKIVQMNWWKRIVFIFKGDVV